MGLLAEGKTRRKINKDPNNTKWTRDETTFGQKILRAQGWQPGEFLGVQNSSHAELHTAANASYIRVVLKDDMKGLGFNRAKQDEVTGLDVFQDLLSRLNGKSEDAIDEERGARMAVKTNYYVEQRYGPMRFVRGGFLVGDEMKGLEDDVSESSDDNADAMEVDNVPKESKKEKKSKKRKAAEEEDSSDRDPESKSTKKRRKEERKSKDTEDTDDAKARRKEKKEKKAKKEKSRSKNVSEKSSVDVSEDEAAQSDERVKKRKSKKDKKEKKKRRKEEAENSDSASTPLAQASATPSGTATPTGTGTSTPRGSRNFVRSRFIAQKRAAVLDTKALAQIFMVKA
ncbi:Fc.00g067160.m01.CDS01 [Cosmosporella sp. VM-42]